MKVYCKNCKWFIDTSYSYDWHYCIGTSYNGYRKAIKPAGKEELNYNGDCKYYKRKWYKFWVEDK